MSAIKSQNRLLLLTSSKRTAPTTDLTDMGVDQDVEGGGGGGGSSLHVTNLLIDKSAGSSLNLPVPFHNKVSQQVILRIFICSLADFQ